MTNSQWEPLRYEYDCGDAGNHDYDLLIENVKRYFLKRGVSEDKLADKEAILDVWAESIEGQLYARCVRRWRKERRGPTKDEALKIALPLVTDLERLVDRIPTIEEELERYATFVARNVRPSRRFLTYLVERSQTDLSCWITLEKVAERLLQGAVRSSAEEVSYPTELAEWLDEVTRGTRQRPPPPSRLHPRHPDERLRRGMRLARRNQVIQHTISALVRVGLLPTAHHDSESSHSAVAATAEAAGLSYSTVKHVWASRRFYPEDITPEALSRHLCVACKARVYFRLK